MTEGKIVSWNKKVGDKISSGDVVLVVESDKADMDVESYEEGYLAKIITPEGSSAAVGSAVAILVADKADIGNVGNAPTTAAAAPATPVAPASTPTSSAPAGQAPTGMSSIMMPALSSTMKEGKIVSWSKKVGDKISSGDVALVVESDKADMDVESYEDGFVAAILVKDGESAEVGKPVALIAKTKEAIPGIQEYAASMKGGVVPPAAQPVASTSTSAAAPAAAASTSAAPAILNDGRVVASGYAQAQAKAQNIDLRTVSPSRPDGYITSKDLSGATPGAPAAYTPTPGTINATPSARKFAAENGIDLSKVKGSGNFGRVTGDDVLIAAGKKTVPAPEPVAAAAAPASSKPAGGAAASATAAVLDGVKPMDGMQKAVAKNMEKTLTVPIFRVSREIVTDNFDALYAQLKPKGVTVSAMLAKAVAEVLKKHPIINAAYVEGGIKYNKDVNVAMAVAIDGGLITPTIIKAQDQDLFSISRVWKELVEKAKSKKLTPAEYSSGTFTISNLGMFGVQQFDAILPPGTGSILAIAASTPKVVQLKNGHFGVQKSMTVTITSDHRHIYGADAAEFLKDLADLLENNVQSLLMG
jgi:pyruvate dehydrogenase E2 component (dihydrolipoamide acetyltransferase)